MWTIILMLFSMIFCHIVDDYYLQGCLAALKQRRHWQSDKIGCAEKYKNDYIMALFMHSFSWSFMIMIPIFIVSDLGIGWLIVIHPVNTVVHMIADDLKANKLKINLVQDQFIHLCQIVLTWGIAVLFR